MTNDAAAKRGSAHKTTTLFVLECVCGWGSPAAILCPYQRFLDRRHDRLVDEVVVTSSAAVGLAATTGDVAAGRHRRVKVDHGDLARSHNPLRNLRCVVLLFA